MLFESKQTNKNKCYVDANKETSRNILWKQTKKQTRKQDTKYRDTIQINYFALGIETRRSHNGSFGP